MWCSLTGYLARLAIVFRRWRAWPGRVASARSELTRRGPRSDRRLPALGREVEQLEYRLALSAAPATPTLIADINTLPVTLAVVAPREFTAVGSSVFFTAADDTGSRSLWKTDGTTQGTAPVPSPATDPTALVSYKNKLFFTADDGVNGRELWQSDGTEAGTFMVTDISATGSGLEGYATPSFQSLMSEYPPLRMVVANDSLFFIGNADDTGHELWKTDGTTGGTALVLDINTVGSSYPTELTALGNTVLFAADDGTHGDELWKSDGTPSGTVIVADINPATDATDPDNPVPIGSAPRWLTAIGTTLYFTADDIDGGRELWKSNGTEAGTVIVRNINPGSSGSDPQWLTAVGTTLYFSADDGVKGRELWKSTGTEAATTIVRNINPAIDSFDPSNPIAAGSDPQWLTAVGTTLYFSADDGVKGRELWKSSGTESGTSLVKDICPVSDFGSNPSWLTNVAGTLYFSADESGSNDDFELWKSNGTAAGTAVAADLNVYGYYSPDSDSYVMGSNPSFLTAVGGKLYFAATADAYDAMQFDTQMTASLYVTTGSTGATEEVRFSLDGAPTQDGYLSYDDFHFGTYYPDPVAFQGLIYFAATNGSSGYELWRTDGTASGTVLVKDILPGAAGSAPGDFTVAGTTLFFTAEGASGRELWKTDGTAAGTVLVKDIAPGTAGSYPYYLTNVNGTLYFTADNGTNGYELWKSNGSAAGTVLVKNIRPDVAGDEQSGSGSYLSSSYPSGFAVIGSTLYFSADDGVRGREL